MATTTPVVPGVTPGTTNDEEFNARVASGAPITHVNTEEPTPVPVADTTPVAPAPEQAIKNATWADVPKKGPPADENKPVTVEGTPLPDPNKLSFWDKAKAVAASRSGVTGKPPDLIGTLWDVTHGRNLDIPGAQSLAGDVKKGIQGGADIVEAFAKGMAGDTRPTAKQERTAQERQMEALGKQQDFQAAQNNIQVQLQKDLAAATNDTQRQIAAINAQTQSIVAQLTYGKLTQEAATKLLGQLDALSGSILQDVQYAAEGRPGYRPDTEGAAYKAAATALAASKYKGYKLSADGMSATGPKGEVIDFDVKTGTWK